MKPTYAPDLARFIHADMETEWRRECHLCASWREGEDSERESFMSRSAQASPEKDIQCPPSPGPSHFGSCIERRWGTVANRRGWGRGGAGAGGVGDRGLGAGGWGWGGGPREARPSCREPKVVKVTASHDTRQNAQVTGHLLYRSRLNYVAAAFHLLISSLRSSSFDCTAGRTAAP